jgi:hypothetical protein
MLPDRSDSDAGDDVQRSPATIHGGGANQPLDEQLRKDDGAPKRRRARLFRA